MPIAPGSPVVVMKFGGTSVSSLSNWQNIAAITRRRLARELKDDYDFDEA